MRFKYSNNLTIPIHDWTLALNRFTIEFVVIELSRFLTSNSSERAFLRFPCGVPI